MGDRTLVNVLFCIVRKRRYDRGRNRSRLSSLRGGAFGMYLGVRLLICVERSCMFWSTGAMFSCEEGTRWCCAGFGVDFALEMQRRIPLPLPGLKCKRLRLFPPYSIAGLRILIPSCSLFPQGNLCRSPTVRQRRNPALSRPLLVTHAG